MWNRPLDRGLRVLMRYGAKRRPPQAFDLSAMEKVNRILLMTTTAIGDTLFSTPAIRAVKETYPQKEVHVLGHVRNRLLLRENPHLDRLLCFRGKARGILSLIRELKEGHYELVIILHGNDPESIPLAWATGAPYIIGSGSSRYAFLLSQGVTCTDPTRHAIERRLDLVRVIGADTRSRKMELYLPPDWEEKAVRILQEVFKKGSRLPLIGLHPTGSGSYKWWPAESFAVLAEKLAYLYGARFVIFSSKREAPVARAIASSLREHAMLVGGGYDLLTVASLMKKCNLFIGNDSGPLHMSLALGVPSLALLGADSPLRIGPYQVENAAFLYKKDEACSVDRCLNQRCPDNRCMQVISPKEVADLISRRFGLDLAGERTVS